MPESNRAAPQVALIAHDRQKSALQTFCAEHREIFSRCQLVATATTGSGLQHSTGLPVECCLSGPLGGDVQIAARVATGDIDAVIFLVDPLYAHPHEPDIQSLMRVCNVHNVPLATNLGTADAVVRLLAFRLTSAG